MFKNFYGNVSKGMKTLWRRVDLMGRKDPDLEILAALGCKSFSFETLTSATNSFNPENMFHEDGLGSMYKGMLENGTEIAVYMLSSHWSLWKRKLFLTGAVRLSRLHHRNVVKLYGYCAHNDQLLIVLKHYPNNLFRLLNTSEGRRQLNWNQRHKIMQGIARGLNYLHSGPQSGIILHRDINTPNIWLDQEWNALIAGFHLGREVPEDETSVSACVPGKTAYIAPEYVMSGRASIKTDVFGFGVIMLELISGQIIDNFLQVGHLIVRAKELLKKGKISEFVDPVLADSITREQVENCVKISLLCLQPYPNSRPQMEDVVSMLAWKWGHIERPIFPHVDEFKEAENVDEEFHYDVPVEEHGNTFRVHEAQNENFEKKVASQNCQKFSYGTLNDATNKFASQNVLGRGGFGLVYNGKLDDGREIAVKKSLSMTEQLRKALMKEVDLLSRVKHPNVVKLVGFCSDNNELLLVSEYVPNKSLDKLLFGPNRAEDLYWSRTYGIIVGIAKGLSYLHDDPQNRIIHRDIKASNILIDHKWVPKIADFGTSRLFDEDQTHVYSGAIGTLGYIAPEYFDNRHVSVKTDVYSFGVLLLELISGKRISFMPPQEDNALSILDWAYRLFKTDRILEFMDKALADSAVVEQVKNCTIIGLLCAQGDPKSRPDMQCVISMLTGQTSHREMLIRRPGIYGYRGYHSGSLFAFGEASQYDSVLSEAQVPLVDEELSQGSASSNSSEEATQYHSVQFEVQVPLLDENQTQGSASSNSSEFMSEYSHTNPNTILAQDDSGLLNQS